MGNESRKYVDEDFTFPKVTVGIVRSRTGELEDRWFEVAEDSALHQIYLGGIDVLVIDNIDRKLSIGAAYNKIVRDCKTDFVLFLGDDDFIMPEYVLSLMGRFLHRRSEDEDIICTTSLCTLFQDGGVSMVNPTIVQGLWYVPFLKKEKFNEKLKRYIDSELWYRVQRKGRKVDKIRTALVNHQFGYYYRAHDEQISGNAIAKMEKREAGEKDTAAKKEVMAA